MKDEEIITLGLTQYLKGYGDALDSIIEGMEKNKIIKLTKDDLIFIKETFDNYKKAKLAK